MMQTFDQPLQQREYLHDGCGQSTHVGGNDFYRLCDPRFDIEQTFCSHCGNYDSLNSFRWTDTKETLKSYRNRLASIIPLWVKVAGGKWLFAVWIILAGVIGYGLSQIVPDFRIAYGIPVALFFAIAMACDAVGKLSTQRIKFHEYQ